MVDAIAATATPWRFATMCRSRGNLIRLEHRPEVISDRFSDERLIPTMSLKNLEAKEQKPYLNNFFRESTQE